MGIISFLQRNRESLPHCEWRMSHWSPCGRLYFLHSALYWCILSVNGCSPPASHTVQMLYLPISSHNHVPVQEGSSWSLNRAHGPPHAIDRCVMVCTPLYFIWEIEIKLIHIYRLCKRTPNVGREANLQTSRSFSECDCFLVCSVSLDMRKQKYEQVMSSIQFALQVHCFREKIN